MCVFNHDILQLLYQEVAGPAFLYYIASGEVNYYEARYFAHVAIRMVKSTLQIIKKKCRINQITENTSRKRQGKGQLNWKEAETLRRILQTVEKLSVNSHFQLPSFWTNGGITFHCSFGVKCFYITYLSFQIELEAICDLVENFKSQ